MSVSHGARLTCCYGKPGQRQGAASRCSDSIASNRGSVSDHTAASHAWRSCLRMAQSTAIICGAHASSPWRTIFFTKLDCEAGQLQRAGGAGPAL